MTDQDLVIQFPQTAETPNGRGRDRLARRVAKRLLPWVGLCLLIYWYGAYTLTHMRIDSEPAWVDEWEIPHPDKFVHLSIYTGLSFLMSVWLGARRRVAGAIWCALFVLLILGGYAAFDEISQASVGRQTDLRDWFADMAGVNLGLFGFFTLRQWLRR